MILQVVFTADARAEMIEASVWYERKRSGLGSTFISEIDRCVDLACKAPLRFSCVRGDIRRILTRTFPYGVYFKLESQRIVVLAVFHASRNPSQWQARI